jgi:flagellar hook-basal body complex protein FliE
MTAIGGLKFQVEQTHLQSLNRARQALDKATVEPSTTETTFSDRLSSGLRDVAEAQNAARDLATAYETGAEQDLTKVMVAQQVSSLGFQLTLNLRNKALSAYKDIMNMPV